MTAQNDTLRKQLGIIIAEGDKNDHAFILTALQAASDALRGADLTIDWLRKDWAKHKNELDEWTPNEVSYGILNSSDAPRDLVAFHQPEPVHYRVPEDESDLAGVFIRKVGKYVSVHKPLAFALSEEDAVDRWELGNFVYDETAVGVDVFDVTAARVHDEARDEDGKLIPLDLMSGAACPNQLVVMQARLLRRQVEEILPTLTPEED